MRQRYKGFDRYATFAAKKRRILRKYAVNRRLLSDNNIEEHVIIHELTMNSLLGIGFR